MFKKDTIMRLVEELGGFVQHLTGLTNSQQYGEAIAESDRVLHDVVGLGSEALIDLNSADLVAHLSMNDGVAWQEKVLFAAAVLAQEAQVYDAMDDDLGRDQRLLCALDLTLAVGKLIPGYGLPAYAPDIDELVDALDGIVYPDTTAHALLDYYTATGQFAEGEDLLFDWRDSAEDILAMTDAGRAFYDTLLLQPDADLAAGGLPRDEVLAGYGAFLNGD